MQNTLAERQSSRPLHSVRLLLESDRTPRLLVLAGAALTFALLAKEYFEPYPYYGPLKIAAASATTALMLSGVVWEVAAGRRQLWEAIRFWSIVGYVALLAGAFRAYQLENRAFFEFIGLLTVFAFIFNHYLDDGYRRPFFLFLSAVAIGGVFGAVNLTAAVGLVVVGLALIAVCHLPIAMWARIAILVLSASVLAVFRSGWAYAGWLAVILPILASIFMFRLPVYLYDQANGKGPKDLAGKLSYFFLFPNLVFPFFPVVDSATYARTYYNEPALTIYERGATFMLRGLIHLLGYRIVHHYLVIAPDEVHGAGTFLQFIFSNFGLYLRVSGMFHLIVGLLLLFGFNLPETHSRFYFSNSFVDFWRRINIYWKDFMQKMVFNPSFVWFKKLGLPHTASMALAIVVVFVGTWVLHAYQWFWLSGTILFTIPDMLFWGILGVFLVAQTLHETSRKPAAAAAPGSWTAVLSRAFLGVRTVCTFFTICLLWSLWTSPTVSEWMALLARSALVPAISEGHGATALEWATTISVLAVVAVAALITAGASFGVRPLPVQPAHMRRKPAGRSAVSNSWTRIGLGAALVGALLVVQMPGVSSSLDTRLAFFAKDLREARLNAADRAMLDRGYYEGLTSGGRFNAELWEFFMNRPQAADAGRQSIAGIHNRDDYLEREYQPNATAYVSDKAYQINEWGLRDEDYTLKKPVDTYRIAMIGASRAVGWGVDYEERFETLLENHMNEDWAADTGRHYEILDFAMDGYVPMQGLITFQTKALRFDPDALIYIAGRRDTYLDHHARMVRQGVEMPYPFLRDLNRRAGVEKWMSQAEITRRLQPYRIELASYVYHHLGEMLRERGMVGIWVFLPNVDNRATDETPAVIEELRRSAESAGFVTIDLSHLFVDAGDESNKALRLSRWDDHPNAAGHKLIADVLLQRLSELRKAGRFASNGDRR